MLTNSIKENNLLNQLTVYKNLIDYEKTKGNYKPLSEYQEKYIELKDTYNKQLKFNEIIKLEKRYNYSEKERLYYKTKTKNLWLLIFMLILIIIASLILLYSTWLQRKLKDKNLQLSEQIKKVEWGLRIIERTDPGQFQSIHSAGKGPQPVCNAGSSTIV